VSEEKSRFRAILRRRCPRCLEGNVYGGWFRPLGACPACGLVYEREPGYFLGSFYISYALGVAVGIPTILFVFYANVPYYWLFLVVAAWVGILSPLIVTYARTLWYHFDHVVDPR
jgi:uncharacterized protein (DUF983 family)